MRIMTSILLLALFAFFSSSVTRVSSGCNPTQILQAVKGYAAGTHGDNAAMTGYDFSGSYPFFNCSTATSIDLNVIDLEDIQGCDAIKANLAGYPPWIGQVYGTDSVQSIEYYVDGPNCFGMAVITRNLIEYVNNRVQTEVFDAKLYFGDNTKSTPFKNWVTSQLNGNGHANGLLNNLLEALVDGSAPYTGQPSGRSNTVQPPQVLLNKIVESNNGGSLARYIFDYFFDSPQTFCGKFMSNCGPGYGWNSYAQCVSYNSQRPYTVSPQNLFIPYGDTMACRNYFMARRLAGPAFGADSTELANRCWAVAPVNPNQPAQLCHY